MRPTSFAEAVSQGLSGSPKGLPPKYFYDARGAELYEEITKQPEYYPTRTEEAILERHAPEILEQAGHIDDLVELGTGSGRKTRLLLTGLSRNGHRATYHAIDIAEQALEATRKRLAVEHPGLDIRALVGDYHSVLSSLSKRTTGDRCVIFLGSSIGNYNRAESRELLRTVRQFVGPGRPFVIGTDLVKDASIIEAAYNDAAGFTAGFNLNVLERMNRELDAEFDVGTFRHRAFFNAQRSRIEMHLESLETQEVRVGALSRSFHFDAGETIHTENSYKYSDTMIADMARDSGFVPEAQWRDHKGWFAVNLWRVR